MRPPHPTTPRRGQVGERDDERRESTPDVGERQVLFDVGERRTAGAGFGEGRPHDAVLESSASKTRSWRGPGADPPACWRQADPPTSRITPSLPLDEPDSPPATVRLVLFWAASQRAARRLTRRSRRHGGSRRDLCGRSSRRPVREGHAESGPPRSLAIRSSPRRTGRESPDRCRFDPAREVRRARTDRHSRFRHTSRSRPA